MNPCHPASTVTDRATLFHLVPFLSHPFPPLITVKQILDISSTCSVTKSCLSLCDPKDYSLQASSLHGISQARILEVVAISFPGDLDPGIEPAFPPLAGGIFTH